MLRAIYRHNDFEYEVSITTRDNTTGRTRPATGLTGLSYGLALTRDGVPIGSTVVALQERVGRLGTYYGVLDAALLDGALGSSVRRAFGILIRAGDVVTYTEYAVRELRPAA